MKPRGGVQVPQGTEAPEMWEPYQIWHSDLWECKGCGSEIVVGHCGSPISRDYMEDFERTLTLSQSVVNDC